MKHHLFIGTLCLILLAACKNNNASPINSNKQVENISLPKAYPVIGSIERFHSILDELIAENAELEIIAQGFEWTEGPVWVTSQEMLLFSDIPPNKIFKWTEQEGLQDYLHPSGYTGIGNYSKESGSNGLLINKKDQLVLCQHGDRRIAIMDAPLDKPISKFITLTDNWQKKRFNSPNDGVFDSQGNFYFTDPPYGLPNQENDISKEISFQGVYHISLESDIVTLLTNELTRPNGIALSPDERTLYIANSDPNQAIWMAFDLEEGSISNGRVLFDATDKVKAGNGLPDGMKVDNQGNIWATGPGGVWVLSPEGTHLGTIKTGQATANCAFNEDKTILYITADMYLLRLKLK